MSSVIEIREPNELDRQTVREFFYAKPMLERGKPLFHELLWVLLGRPDEEGHAKGLPDYCYAVFDALRKTFFKNFPAITDIIHVRDQAGLAGITTIETAKKAVQMDWKNMGRMCGIAARCFRFAELEAEKGVDGEGFDDCPPDKLEQLFTILFGKQWVAENAARIATEKPDKILAAMLNEFIAEWVAKAKEKQTEFESLAYRWSPSAQVEFSEGFTAGLTGFLDENAFLAGESNRSETYVFLLLAWPEIQAMLAAAPQKNVTDLHEWMLPFMRVGVTTYLDIDKLRDICAPPASGGIGLSLRPLKSRLSPASA